MFVGREYELKLIRDRLADTSKAQLIVLYGRRRVGKSTLIREGLKARKNVLFFEGIQGADTATQIDQFLTDLARQTGRVKLAAKHWRDVFLGLEEVVREGKWVVVFDEFPWMAAGRSAMVSDLKLYWDRWLQNQRLTLILCGSVASFMTKHLVHSKALHNRKTLELCLGPLTPKESGQFIVRRSLWEKAALYMCLGGVPKYLEQVDPKVSLEKNLDRLCFRANGFFVNEFETLFKEQFRSVKTYQEIVRHLAKSPLSLSELADKVKLERGGGFSSYLENLCQAHFVRAYVPYAPSYRAMTRTKQYKLVDPFLIFYFRYISPNLPLIEKNTKENLFRAITGASLHQYYGFAFERLCEDSFLTICEQLDLALGDIRAMGPYFRQKRGRTPGFQIDNLIMRRDGVWTILEYKYHRKPIGTEVIQAVAQKVELLRVPQDISVEKVLVTAHGVTQPVRRANYFDTILTLSDLLR